MTAKSWTKSLLITIGLQAGIVLACGIVAGGLGGLKSAVSLVAGGASVAIPNAVLGAYLWLKSNRVGALSAATFLGGEIVKLMATVLVLYQVVRYLGETTVWLALIIGVVVALKGQWLAVWFTRDA